LPSALAATVAPFTEAALEVPSPPEGDVVLGIMQRAYFTPIHKWLGIATWGANTLYLAIDVITYRDRYGGGGSHADTPCLRGDAVFGPRQCFGAPNAQVASSLIKTGLYLSSVVTSFLLPDPVGLDRGRGHRARHLRMHKRLRWVVFGAFLSRFLISVVAIHPGLFGLDRDDDFHTIRAFARTELVLAGIAYGSLTASGAVVLHH
jgi:hypothetical protein